VGQNLARAVIRGVPIEREVKRSPGEKKAGEGNGFRVQIARPEEEGMGGD